MLPDSSRPVTLFCKHCRAECSMLSSLGHVSTILHPNPKRNLRTQFNVPQDVNPEVVFVKWCELPQRGRGLHNYSWGLCPARVASGQLWFASVAGNSAAYGVCGRELVWWLYGKPIIPGIVILSFSCQRGFIYQQKEQWRAVISRNVHLLAETAVAWLNSFWNKVY